MLEKKYIYATQKVTSRILKNKIILIIRSNSKGSEGIIANADKIMDVGFTNQKEQKINTSVYLGGTYSTGGIYLVHGYEDFLFNDAENVNNDKIDQGLSLYEEEIDPIDKLKITDGIYFGSSHSFLKIKEQNAGPNHKFYSGQLYWPKYELHMEIEAGYWGIIDDKFDYEVMYNEEKAESLYRKKRWIDRPREAWLFDPPPFFDPTLN